MKILFYRTQRFSRNYPPHGREDQEANSDHSLLLIHLFPKLPKSIYHLLNKGTSTVLNWDYLIFFQLLKHWALKGNIFFWNGFLLVSHHVWLVMAIRSFLTSIFDFFFGQNHVALFCADNSRSGWKMQDRWTMICIRTQFNFFTWESITWVADNIKLQIPSCVKLASHWNQSNMCAARFLRMND